MLVLTRKTQEQIVIGENIKVTILRVKGNTVKVGIEAPRQVRVIRSELPSAGSLSIESGKDSIPQAAPLEKRPRAGAGETGRCPTAGPLTAFLVGLALNDS